MNDGLAGEDRSKGRWLRSSPRRRMRAASLRSAAALLAARRALAAVPVLVGISLLTFWIVDLLPGSAAQSLLGADATPEQVGRLEAELRLDRSGPERYFEWIGLVLRGDLGRSIASGQPVSTLISERLPVTLELLVLALAFSLGFAIAVAVLAARRRNGLLDRIAAVASLLSLSTPSYISALILVVIFAVTFDVLPSIGFTPLSEGLLGNFTSLILPASALAGPFFGLYCGFLRGDLFEQLEGQNYIVTARAKGLNPWQVLLRHALRNSLFGLITVVGLNLGPLLGGAVIIEQIFALPGMGQLLLQAVNTRDIVVVQAVVLLMATVTLLATLCADLLYVALDPRVHYERR